MMPFMTSKDLLAEPVPFFVSCSNTTTEANKTGSWRFLQPRYARKTAPCSAACPAGEDIARVEMLACKGRLEEAVQIILRENPFPSVCGRVCFHPCEGVCNRGKFDEPVSVRQIERFLGDKALESGKNHTPVAARSNGKRVAVLGGGPAGLSAGYFFVQLGFECELFEAAAEPGGLLRWGIPRYRLPEDVLREEIRRIERLGLVIHCRSPFSEEDLKELQKRWDALFLACGHGCGIRLGIPGEAYADDGLAFLSRVRSGSLLPMTGKAAVIGGGNTAVDVARSLRRFGLDPVIVYRRTRRDMPAFAHEVAMAVDEGVELMELTAPLSIIEEPGGLLLNLQKMRVSDRRFDGRSRVIPDGGRVETLRVQKVFTAIGAVPAHAWQVPPKDRNRILTLSHCTLVDGETPMVFGGDLNNIRKSVADAVASGKQAAMALDTLFHKGRAAIQDRLAPCRLGDGPALSMEIFTGGRRKENHPHVVSYEDLNPDYFEPSPRAAPGILAVEKRVEGFAEVESTLAAPAAALEAGRCFNCGTCNDCDNCRLFCPEMAVTVENLRQIDLQYCKGCGICVVECPRCAMVLQEETA